MLEFGEDRLAKRLKKRVESERTNEVLLKHTADQSVPFVDVVHRTVRKTEAFWSDFIDHTVPSSRNGPRSNEIRQAQVADDLLERQLRQIVQIHFGLVHFGCRSAFG